MKSKQEDQGSAGDAAASGNLARFIAARRYYIYVHIMYVYIHIYKYQN
jgi:hypothetical protein